MRFRHPVARLVCLALAALGLVAVAPSTAWATPTIGSGTLMYRKGPNIYATNGEGTRQITTDGGTPSADGKGSTGYLSPSESDDGSVIVAFRNQSLTHPGDNQVYQHGYLWVMDAYGHVVRKINPPQFDYVDTTTCGLPANNPLGIINAYVSPDGKHIAYTYAQRVEIYSIYFGGCSVGTSYRTTVVAIDGSDPVPVDNGAGSNESLDTGSWVNSSTLLLDDHDFGSVQAYYASLPQLSGTAWFAPNDYTDTAYLQPDYRNGVVVTQGLSDATNAKVVRVWTSAGLGQSVNPRCEQGSTVSSDDELGDPSLSPDGSQVAYEDTGAQESTSAAGQGVYVMDTSNCSTALLVPGANDAFWSAASRLTPPADTTAPSVSVAATPTAIAATTMNLAWSGSDSGSGIASYQIRARAAAYNAGFGSWFDVGDPDPSTSAGLSNMSPGTNYCFDIVATDNAGNTATSEQRCTTVALDDRNLAASSGWRRITGSAYFQHTATQTSKRGASLSRSGALTNRVGIVATTCAKCGSVGLYVGRTLVGRVDLHSSTTHTEVVKLLPAFARRSATVSVKVLSSGKPVTIDGFVNIHS
jgi:hypothetical protein